MNTDYAKYEQASYIYEPKLLQGIYEPLKYNMAVIGNPQSEIKLNKDRKMCLEIKAKMRRKADSECVSSIIEISGQCCYFKNSEINL